MDVNRLVCRLCLFKGNTQDFVDIFADNMKLVNTIKDCLSLPISATDCLPKTVCHSCLNSIEKWSKFKEFSWNSNRLLQQFYIKTNTTQGDARTKQEDINDLCNINFCTDNKDATSPTIDLSISSKAIADNKIISKFTDFQNASVQSCEYTCDHCTITFTTLIEYLDHQSVHKLDKILFNCELCNEKYTSRDELLAHENEHNKRNSQQKCLVCGKTVKKRSMYQHMNQHNDKFKCDLCGLRCNAPSVLATHKLTVHTTQRPHFCSTCGKRFNRMRNLREHLATHSNERNFPCIAKNCTYAARIKHNLRLHLVRKHPEMNQESAAVCIECGKTFKTSRHLGDHLRRMHSKTKKHECRFCDMKFIDRHLLTTHIMKHTGERPFQCQICDKGFTRADGLKNHMEIHQRSMSYTCNSCGKEFLTKQGRNRHKCTRIR